MASPSILDLDSIPVEETHVIILGGLRHVMREMTVEDMIKTEKAVQVARRKEAEGKTGDLVDESIISNMVDQVRISFPTIPEDQLQKLGFDKLLHILKFMRSTTQTVEGEAATPVEGADANPPMAG